MNIRKLFAFFIGFFPLLVSAQNTRTIDHKDVHRWKKIDQQKVANDGQWVCWAQTPVTEGDSKTYLWNSATNNSITFDRASDAAFTDDSKWLVFRIKTAIDSLKALRRKKTKEEDLPKDTLAVYNLKTGALEKFPRLESFAIPEKWSGWLFGQFEPEKAAPAPKDTSKQVQADTAKTNKAVKPKNTKKPKKEDKENGYRLVIRHLESGKMDTMAYVKDYLLAKKAPQVLVYCTGKGDTLGFSANPIALQNGVYQLDLQRNTIRPLWRGKGNIKQLSISDNGAQSAFLLDVDTTKARIRPWSLCYGTLMGDTAKVIAQPGTEVVKLAGTATGSTWGISEHSKPSFSEDGSKMYFGIAPDPILNDTTLLAEEIVNVEVWAWTENRIYTQQKAQLEQDKKRSYPVVWHVSKDKFVQLSTPEMPELRMQESKNAEIALGYSEEPYAKYISWEGEAHKDLFVVNLNSGDKKLIVKGLRCNPRLSPEAGYIAWWSDPDTAWFAWNIAENRSARLTVNEPVAFYNEESDVPDYPNAHGIAAWASGDEYVLIYDQFDIWRIDPAGNKSPERLTKGRENNIVYRYLKLDPEERTIEPDSKLLLHQFNRQTKAEGYAWLDLNNNKTVSWVYSDHAYSKAPIKPKNAQNLLFTKENYQTFPDLNYSQCIDFQQLMKKNAPENQAKFRVISQANPQQAEYNWGAIEMVQWTSLSGEKLSGLLVKPTDFDPKKQYPMIVNFYEKLSDDLHRHRSPDFHRSQINFTVYASKGYLVFAPDIPYRTGYPGECAYDAIVSGVTALINQGFVDGKRVALQGHSWGGYQAAYLVTRTNLFKCAEAGAPVANMTSAYGGIRWESGLSRAFQYEHQQSRIGGSLWEYPMRYLENSPLFSLDKVQTPLLILHNDKDGAVPWYQGIELYSGLRRLGKPTWLLNYNDEPHWPVKLQNRIDFQRRMQQFFDYYLMGAAEPNWMKRGVPPKEKGILQGLD